MAEFFLRRVLFLKEGILTVLIIAIVSGCHQQPALKTIPVRGTVTSKGKPVAGAIIKFLPVNETKGRSALAVSESNGTYEVKTLNNSPGLVPGDYRVIATNAGPGVNINDKKANHQIKTKNSELKLTIKPDDTSVTFNIFLD